MKSSRKGVTTILMDAQLIEIVVKIHEFFKDYKKTAAWITTPNPHFGNIAPIRLIGMGRAHKVIQFIDGAREGLLP